MTFAEKIKYVRIVLNLSQEELARKINVSYATINRLENSKNKPKYETLLSFEKFCKENNIEFE